MKQEFDPQSRLSLKEWLGMALGLGLFILLNYCLLRWTGWVPKGDAADHLVKSFQCLRALREGNIPYFCWGDGFYPPLVYQITALSYFLFRPSVTTVVMSQIPYWAVLIFAVYGLGRRLFSPLAGWLGVFFILTCPLTLMFCYQYMLDIPAAAFTALGLYLLLRSDEFRCRGYALAFGVNLGLGLLAKWWVGYLLLGPLVYYLFKWYFAYFRGSFERLAGLLLSGGFIGLALLFAGRFGHLLPPDSARGFWLFLCALELLGLAYWLGMNLLIRRAEKTGQALAENREPLVNFLLAMMICYFLCGWLYFNPNFALLNGQLVHMGAYGSLFPWPSAGLYPKIVWQVALKAGFTPFLVIGLVVFGFKFRQKKVWKIYAFALLWAALALVIMPNKQERYLLPWLAMASPLAVFWLDYLGQFKALGLWLLLTVGFSFAAAGWLFPSQWYLENAYLNRTSRGDGPLTIRNREITVKDDELARFLRPLPRRGERLFIFIRLPQPVGDNLVRNYLYFQDYRVDLTERFDLREYDYLIYSRLYSRPDDAPLCFKLGTQIRDVGGCRLKELSRLDFPAYGFTLKLCRVEKTGPSR